MIFSKGIKLNQEYVNTEAAAKIGEVVSFSFGSNWKRYLDDFTEARLEAAVKSLQEFSGLHDLHGHSFLDFGCGSGIFSMAARELGAESVTSIDIDPGSVECVSSLRDRRGKPENWRVLQGSALDQALITSLGSSSFVYSWGVLHHTGSMYDAIRNVAALVAPGGLYYLGIYNRNKHAPKWLRVKRIYNRMPMFLKPLMVGGYVAINMLMILREGENPFRVIRSHGSSRGMSWLSDIRDWLGGLPYEFASVEEIETFVSGLGFETKRVRPNGSHGCNEFLFIRSSETGPSDHE